MQLTRRQSPRRRVRPVFSFFLVVAIVGGGWFAYQRYPDRAATLMADMTAAMPAATAAPAPLPAPAERNYPTPGHEEAGGPLGAVPIVTAAATQYALHQTQTTPDGVTVPVTWSPCRPIHFVVNSSGAPDGFADQVRVAIAGLSTATGLAFLDDGASTEAVDFHRTPFLPAMYGDRWAPVLVQFADATTVTDLAAAVGLAMRQTAQDPTTGASYLVSGVVYLDTELLGLPGRTAEPAYVPVLRHELGHLAGLDHVNDPTQLMYPVNNGVITYQPGDLAGLAALGHGACAPGV